MPNEVLDRFRQKYPQYQNVDDSTLAAGIVKKYPQYSIHLQDVLNPPQPTPVEPTQSYGQAVRDIVAPWANPQNVQKLRTGIQQAKEGSPITGGLNIANAAIQSAFTPISAMAGQLKKIPVIGEYGVPLVSAIPQGFQAIGSGITGALADQYRYGGFVPGFGVMPPPFKNEKQAEEFKQAASETGGNVAMFAAPIVAKPIGRGLESTASKMAGRAFGVGNNYLETKAIGKVAQEAGITRTAKGLEKATTFANQLNTEINSKIIDPATQSGLLLDGSKYIEAMQNFKNDLQNRSVPDRASIMAVDRMINAAQERLSRTKVPGYLTPEEAQNFKVTNNQILSDVYSKLKGGANLTEKGTSKKASLVEATDTFRKQLEDLHPELKGANWSEGAFLELKNAIYNELNRSAKGEGTPGIVLRGGSGGRPATASIYDLLKIKNIEARLAIALGKVGRGLSGNPKTVKYGVQNPFQASPLPFTGPPTFPTPPTTSPTPPPAGASPFTTPTAPISTVDLMKNKLDLLKQSVTPGIDENALKTTVESGGGKYVGIQETGGEPYVEFNDKSGGTHAILMSQATPENISNYLKTNSLKSTQETMTPKITPEDLAAYRQYIASGGNLNVSDWMKTRK